MEAVVELGVVVKVRPVRPFIVQHREAKLGGLFRQLRQHGGFHLLGDGAAFAVHIADFGLHDVRHGSQHYGQLHAPLGAAGGGLVQPVQLAGVQRPVFAFGDEGGGVLGQQGVNLIHRAVGGGVVLRVDPVAGLGGVHPAGELVLQVGEHVHVVFQIEKIGEGIVQGLFQIAHPVGVVALVDGVEGKAEDHFLQVGIVIQRPVQKVDALPQRRAAEGQILPGAAAGLFHQVHVEVGKAGIADDDGIAGLAFEILQPADGSVAVGVRVQAEIVVGLKGRKQAEIRQHRNQQQRKVA